MKTLLIDIDHTLFHDDIPRPHLKLFLDTLRTKYNIYFYTAGTSIRVTEVCRILLYNLNMDKQFVIHLNRFSLHSGNCSMIEYYKPEYETSILVKCLDKASKVLNIPKSEFLHIDDTLMYDWSDLELRLKVPAFYKEDQDINPDNYLLTLLKEL